MSAKFISGLLCCTLILPLAACEQKNTAQVQQSAQQSHPETTNTPEKPIVWPEQDETKTGTPVLGFKLGDSTYTSVTRTLSGWDELGINSYSQGKMIATNGNGYGVDRLTKVTYIFDQNETLQAILMQIDNRDAKMGNEGFKKFKGYIEQRGYKRISNQEPFVGNQYAEYVTPNGDVIELSAPHMSFDLRIDYQTAAFMKTFNTQQQQQKTEQTQTEAAQF
ncbi:hypothetical protein [Acinetobacter sp. ASP199]|uniref:hypothetical protein n=1 Tax=unclassified Acinetobacter TaxID=196816 RepID=UPI001F6092AB|nr:hypothetical protein [Acinetobacter sp. ASP199]UNT58296.1 hypothetical protein IHE35_09135 [Acinetobacter sp. ASP199]